MKLYHKLAFGLVILAFLSPLGLWLPAFFHAGSAWGEWSPEEVHQLIGYLPKEMIQLAQVWKALLPDYALPAWGQGWLGLTLGYLLSALIGIGVCGGALWIWAQRITKKKDPSA